MASNQEVIGWTQKNGSQMIPLVWRLGYQFGIFWHNIGLCIASYAVVSQGFFKGLGFSSCTRRQRSIAEISQRSGRSSSGAQLAPTATMENSKLRPGAQLGPNAEMDPLTSPCWACWATGLTRRRADLRRLWQKNHSDHPVTTGQPPSGYLRPLQPWQAWVLARLHQVEIWSKTWHTFGKSIQTWKHYTCVKKHVKVWF